MTSPRILSGKEAKIVKDTDKNRSSGGLPLSLNNIPSDMVDSITQGYESYINRIKHNPSSLAETLLISGALGLLYTMLPKNMRLIKLLYLLVMLPLPVKAGLESLPVLWRAEKLSKEGRPKYGEARFRKALTDFMYEIFIVYTKPLSIAGLLFYPLLSMGKIHKAPGKGKNLYEYVWKFILSVCRVPKNFKPFEVLEKHVTQPLVDLGQKATTFLSKQKALAWLLQHVKD